MFRIVATAAAIVTGGSFTLGFVASVSEQVTEFKKRTHRRPCKSCKAIGHYTCKLCKGNGTIKWSPLYDPVFINPCICPTCDGFKVQRCLNCVGYGKVP